MIVSAVVGFIAAIILAIFAGHEYGRGYEAWTQFIVDNGVRFLGCTLFCYVALCIWQFAGNSIWDIRRAFKKFCDNMLRED